MESLICFCGHNCAQCKIYLGTVKRNAQLIAESREFYKSEFGTDLPSADFRCLGGRSDCVFRLCEGCPFRKCCLEKGIGSCRDCENYPCRMISDYEKKYVNQVNQVERKESLKTK